MCLKCVSLCFLKKLFPQPFLCPSRPAGALQIPCFLIFPSVLAMAALATPAPETSLTSAPEETELSLVQGNTGEDSELRAEAAACLESLVAGSPAKDGEAPDATVSASADAGDVADAVTDDKKVTCRRCGQKVDSSEALETPKFRMDLRWTCKPCHACQTQLTRHGIEIKSLLSESEAVAFFAEARAQRENSIDKRLTYAQARGMLKQAMVESSSREDREGDHGAYQPLAYYELKGYNTERIEQLADCREHPILGATYRVDITKQSKEFVTKLTEERIVRLETEFRQRQERAAAAAASQETQPPLRLDLPAADPEPMIGRVGKKRKTEEEKKEAQQALKAQKLEAKKRQKLETAAVTAAGKFLPNLQKVHARLSAAIEKTSQLGIPLAEEDNRLVTEAQGAVSLAMANASKMLSGASKGQGLASIEEAALLNDKGTQEVLKQANTAVRTLQEFCRANKENAARPKATAKKGKKQ